MLPSGAHFSINSDENINDFLGYSIGNKGYFLESSYYVLGVKDFTYIISKCWTHSELGVIFPFFTGEDLKTSYPHGREWGFKPISSVCISFLTDKEVGSSQHLPQSTCLVVASVLCTVLYSLGSEFTHLSSSCPHHYISVPVHLVAFIVNQRKPCRWMCPSVSFGSYFPARLEPA